jgi:hypothetical protein
MPTAVALGPYRAFFYLTERGEPPQSVECGDKSAKIPRPAWQYRA